MTYYQQPWGRSRVSGHPCRLQVLDPQTAFDLEPALIDRFGDALVMAIAAPRHVFGSLWASVQGSVDYGETFADAVSLGSKYTVAAAGLRRVVDIMAAALMRATIDGQWVANVFAQMVFDRFKIDGALVEDWAAWSRAGLGPRDRWHVLAWQMQQTYGPLWLRAPYSVRSKKQPDFGVPLPKGVPMAMQWADALTTMGHVGSSHEVLTSWTPVQLMDAVDMAAYKTEMDRQAMEAAQAGSR